MLREINDISPVNVKDKDWQEAFDKAIFYRSRWWDPISNFPSRVADGLRTEYLHARVQRISVEKDKKNIERMRKELEPYILSWRESPSIKSIRLSENVISAWEKLKSS